LQQDHDSRRRAVEPWSLSRSLLHRSEPLACDQDVLCWSVPELALHFDHDLGPHSLLGLHVSLHLRNFRGRDLDNPLPSIPEYLVRTILPCPHQNRRSEIGGPNASGPINLSVITFLRVARKKGQEPTEYDSLPVESLHDIVEVAFHLVLKKRSVDPKGNAFGILV
jgi:hypothetical protein